MLAHQHSEHVVTGGATCAGHQRLHVGTPGALQLEAFLDRDRQVELPAGAVLEIVAVVIRHAQQLADHQ